MELIDKAALPEHKFPEVQCNGFSDGSVYRQGWNDAIDAIMDNEDTVDAVPVRHGRWECSDHYENAVCSECGYDTGEAWGFGYGRGCYKFCPHCGADMRKDGNDD